MYFCLSTSTAISVLEANKAVSGACKILIQATLDLIFLKHCGKTHVTLILTIHNCALLVFLMMHSYHHYTPYIFHHTHKNYTY